MGSADAAAPARPPTIDTGGGAYLAGPVEVSGGTIVWRDKHLAGDLVRGDQYWERVALSTVFVPVRQAVATAALPPVQQTEALQTVRDLETEAESPLTLVSALTHLCKTTRVTRRTGLPVPPEVPAKMCLPQGYLVPRSAEQDRSGSLVSDHLVPADRGETPYLTELQFLTGGQGGAL